MSKKIIKCTGAIVLTADALKMKEWMLIWSIRNTDLGYVDISALVMADNKPAAEWMEMPFRLADELLPEFLKINNMEGSFYAKETPEGLAELEAAHVAYLRKMLNNKK